MAKRVRRTLKESRVIAAISAFTRRPAGAARIINRERYLSLPSGSAWIPAGAARHQVGTGGRGTAFTPTKACSVEVER